MMLRTARLVLRPILHSDGSALLELIDNWEVVKWLARVPWPYTAADMDAYLAHATQTAGTATPCYVIVLGEEPIGQIVCGGTHAAAPPEDADHVGFWLGEPFWGRGYMGEALSGLIGHVLATRPEVEVIRSGWFDGNAASARVHAKTGFVATGRTLHYCNARRSDLPLVTAELTRTRFEQRRP